MRHIFAETLKAAFKALPALVVATLLFTCSVVTQVGAGNAHAKAMNSTNADAVVVCAYRSFLDRAPDQSGRVFWRNRYIETRNNAVRLGSSLYSSAEGQKYENIYNFDAFISRTYTACLGRSPSASERKTWSNKHLSGMSRAQIFGFIVVAGDKPWTIPSDTDCTTMPKNSSVVPKCKANTAGGYLNVATATVPGSNITVNKALLTNVTNLRTAAAKSRFNLQAHQDAGAPIGAGSYRTPATQQWLRDHGYAAARSVSMHQWGLAIDFDCNGVSLAANSECLAWMRSNGRYYGLYQLPTESWHWSSNGS